MYSGAKDRQLLHARPKINATGEQKVLFLKGSICRSIPATLSRSRAGCMPKNSACFASRPRARRFLRVHSSSSCSPSRGQGPLQQSVGFAKLGGKWTLPSKEYSMHGAFSGLPSASSQPGRSRPQSLEGLMSCLTPPVDPNRDVRRAPQNRAQAGANSPASTAGL